MSLAQIPANLLFVSLALLLLPGGATAADFEVRSPIIDVHELEYDSKFSRGFDRTAWRANGRAAVHEMEFGVNEWWSPAIEAEWGRQGGANERSQFQAFTFENRFQLSKQGENWADVGLFLEYERGAPTGTANAIRFGPLFRKDIGSTTNILDFLAVKERGPDSRRRLTYSYAWQTRWRLSEEFQPGFELYGGALEAGRSTSKQHLGGPVIFGAVDLGERQGVRYEIGYLYGLNDSTSHGIAKILVGYEYRF